MAGWGRKLMRGLYFSRIGMAFSTLPSLNMTFFMLGLSGVMKL